MIIYGLNVEDYNQINIEQFIFLNLYLISRSVMGGNQSSITTSNNFNPNEWEQIYHDHDGHILMNRYNPNQRIEEHPIALDDRKSLELAQELYKLRLNDPQLVATNYINIQKQDQMCSKSYSGNIYTQYIPIRLSNIVHVPFPDVLHLYNQSLNGFHRLSKQLGNFKVNQDCIGVNQNHVAKVWHSPNFSQVYPQYPIDSEHDMVRNIVEIIETNTDPASMPIQQPLFSNFLYKENVRVGFGQAKKKLQQYANHFNRGVIPHYLACVQKAGGANNIRNKWNQTNNQFNSKPTNINQYPLQYTAGFSSSSSQVTPVYHTTGVVNSRPVVTSEVPNPKLSQSQTGHFYQSQTFAPRNTSRVETPFIINQPGHTIKYHRQSQSANNFYPRYQSHFVSTSPPPVIRQIQPTLFRDETQKPLSARISQPIFAPQEPVKPVSNFTSPTVQPLRFETISPILKTQPAITSQVHNYIHQTQFSNQPQTANVQITQPVLNVRPLNTQGTVIGMPQQLLAPKQIPVQHRINAIQNRPTISKSANIYAFQQVTNQQSNIQAQKQQAIHYQPIQTPTFIKQNQIVQTGATQSFNSTTRNKTAQNQLVPAPQKQVAVVQPLPLVPVNSPTTNIKSINFPTTNIPQHPNLNLLSNPFNQLVVAPSHAVVPSNPNLNKQRANQPQPSKIQGQQIKKESTNQTQTQNLSVSQQNINQQQFVPNRPNQPQLPLQQPVGQLKRPQWTGDVLNWQFQQHFQPPSQVQQFQSIPLQNKQSPQKPNVNINPNNTAPSPNTPQQAQPMTGIDLEQANSASSRYKEQSEGFSSSPNRFNRTDEEIKGQLKSQTDSQFRVNESISSITGKQGQDSSYSGMDWHNTNDYSSTYKTGNTNKLDELYLNKQTYDVPKQEEGNYKVQDTYGSYNYEFKTNENYGNANNTVAYSFGENADMRDYFHSYSGASKYGSSPVSNTQNYKASSHSPKTEEIGPTTSYNYSNKYESTTDYGPIYSYESKNQHRQYTNRELTSGYRVNQRDNNITGYEKTTQNLVTGKKQVQDSKRFDDAEFKYSMAQDHPYNVQWDPQILADLKANAHRT